MSFLGAKESHFSEGGEEKKKVTLLVLFRMVFLKITTQDIYIIFLKKYYVLSPRIPTTQKHGSLTPFHTSFLLYFLTKFVSILYFGSQYF